MSFLSLCLSCAPCVYISTQVPDMLASQPWAYNVMQLSGSYTSSDVLFGAIHTNRLSSHSTQSNVYGKPVNWHPAERTKFPFPYFISNIERHERNYFVAWWEHHSTERHYAVAVLCARIKCRVCSRNTHHISFNVIITFFLGARLYPGQFIVFICFKDIFAYSIDYFLLRVRIRFGYIICIVFWSASLANEFPPIFFRQPD